MKNITKLLGIIALIVVVIFSMAACKSTPPAAEAPAEVAAEVAAYDCGEEDCEGCEAPVEGIPAEECPAE